MIQGVDQAEILHELKVLNAAIPDPTYICKYYSGTVTLTAGAGNVTVNIPFDWTGGFIKVAVSGDTTRWVDDGTTFNQALYQSSYDALTAAGYTNTNEIVHRVGAVPYNDSYIKTVNAPAALVSATTTTVVLNDMAANTSYAKYFIWSRGA